MAAAGKIALVLGFALFVFLLQNAAAQTVHIVGDATGWAAPQNGADFYAKWAAGKKFVVGDSLGTEKKPNFYELLCFLFLPSPVFPLLSNSFGVFVCCSVQFYG